MQEKLVSIENIQKTVADYFKIRVADLLSKKRSRSIAGRGRLRWHGQGTDESQPPEIGDAFGGRDHTTVLHGCRRIQSREKRINVSDDDYLNLLRTLTG